MQYQKSFILFWRDWQLEGVVYRVMTKCNWLCVYIQGGQKSVTLFSSNFLKMVKDTKTKLSHLKENRFDKLYATQFMEKFQSN